MRGVREERSLDIPILCEQPDEHEQRENDSHDDQDDPPCDQAAAAGNSLGSGWIKRAHHGEFTFRAAFPRRELLFERLAPPRAPALW